MARAHYDLERMKQQAEGSLDLRRHMMVEAFERQGQNACLGCGRRPAGGAGTFLLTEEEACELAAQGGRAMVFPLCERCEQHLDDFPGLRADIAGAVLDRVAAGLVVSYPGG